METRVHNDRLGGNIDCWCGKCKLVLAHTIEAMVGDRPARVHCNTCRSQHSYRPNPPGAQGETRQRDAMKGPRQHRGRMNRYQLLLNERNGSAVKAYSPKDSYEPGDVLEHSTFGRGVTTGLKEGLKIEVLFESGSKTLVHGR
jgi:hypothetical protein